MNAQYEAKVSSVNGAVQYQAPGSKIFQPLKVNQKLMPGTTIKTGASSNAIILTVPGAGMHIAENTTIVLTEYSFNPNAKEGPQRKTLVDLRSGTVSALINKDISSQTDFKIKTPQGTASARGTFYGVTYDGKKTYVAVKEGKVGVSQISKKR
ncbi:MAG: FecR family protein [Methylacidiphilales bacterium]|nr:FecR family protein [Candidatus Methylacidiphilales bacterium]